MEKLALAVTAVLATVPRWKSLIRRRHCSHGSVLDVLARASFRVLRRCLSVSVGVQNAHGVDQGQCFVPWRGLAGFHVTVGPSRGHIPFQAVILDLEVAAYVKRGNAIFQA